MRPRAAVAQLRRAAASSHASLVGIRLTTVVLTLVTLRFLSHRMGSGDYSVYIITIQLLAWPMSLGLIGMGISIPRTIAARSSKWAPEAVLTSAALLAAATLVLPLVLIAVLSPEVSGIVLKDRHWAPAIAQAALYMATLAPVQLVSYYLVGLKHFRAFVAMELIQSGVVPVLLALFDPGAVHIELFLFHYSLGNLALLLVTIGLTGASRSSEGLAGPHFIPSRAIVKELLNTGTPKLISGLFFTLTVSSFPVALRWSGAGLEQTAAASLGLAIALTLSRLAITANALAGFMHIASVNVADRKSALNAARQMLTFALAGGFTLAMLSAAAIDLAVSVLIGPAYERQHLFLGLGAVFGSLYFVAYAIEIPLDALEPAWEKAAASSVFAIILAALIPLGVGWGILGTTGVLAAYWAIFALFCLVLYFLVQRAFADPIRPDPVLLRYVGYCVIVTLALVVGRTYLPGLPAQVVVGCAAVFLILLLMARFGLFRTGMAGPSLMQSE